MLKSVPPSQPSPAEQVRQRIRRERPDGIVQCNRCGSRTVMNTVTGAFISKGRIQGGTKTDVNVCYHCHARGIFSEMLPQLKRIE